MARIERKSKYVPWNAPFALLLNFTFTFGEKYEQKPSLNVLLIWLPKEAKPETQNPS